MEGSLQRERLSELLELLTARHREALQWFDDRSGEEIPWPQPLETSEGSTFLATKAKGIYKPEWSEYALSVRQTLAGKYPDLDPVVHADGTWSYAYFQEADDPSSRDDEYTNRGLMDCWRDRVPVAVMRQTQERPTSRYKVLGVAVVAGWSEGYFLLEGFNSERLGRADRFLPIVGSPSILPITNEQSGFDFSKAIDAREKTLAQIALRRGQPQFRKQLLVAYDSKCAISGYDAPAALEACHIYPYRGPDTNHVANGLLLRGDLHTLFDLGFIVVESRTMKVVISQSIKDTKYDHIAGTVLRTPIRAAFLPSSSALDAHRSWAGF